jgi:AraC-like DNA-binding protein
VNIILIRRNKLAKVIKIPDPDASCKTVDIFLTQEILDTPENWLRERRLEEAKYLISEKGQKPSEVYYKVGFENLSHFSTAFKQKFGYTASGKNKNTIDECFTLK